MEKEVAVIYGKTVSGERAESALAPELSADMLRALTLIDGEATLDEMLAKLPNRSGLWLEPALADLVREGYVELVENGPDEAPAGASDDDKARLHARAQRRLAARAREEAERLAREEAERKAKEEAERRAQEEEARRIREEAERRKREEDARIVREEAERIAREEAERKAREEAERKAREEAERKAREEAERKAREEAERKAKEEAARMAKLEAERKAQDERERRLREEAERKAREEAEADERERAEIEIRVRALAEARAKEEERAEKKKPIRVRQPVPWGTLALGVLATLLVLPLVLLHILSLNMLIPAIEKLSSEWMHEPVAVGSVHASLWPTPHFKLENVAIGTARDIKISHVSVMPDLTSLFGDTLVIRTVEVESLVLDQDSLSRATDWLGHGDPKKMQLGRVALKNAKVNVKGFELPPFAADIQVSKEGRFQRAHLGSLDRKLEADVEPRDSKFAVNVRANRWQPPFGPKLMIDELIAKATASREGLQTTELTARLYGGTAKGNAIVKWGQRWVAEGSFDLANVELGEAAAVFTGDIALSGRLNANAVYALEAEELARLFEAPRIRASFSSRDGAIGTLDFAHALQSRAREYVGSGKTGYTNWTGNLALADKRYRYSQMNLAAGLLHASGEADIGPNKDLSGRASVEMQLKSANVQARFAVSGSLNRLVLRRTD